MKFKVGDRVKYDSGDTAFVDTGIIIKVDECMYSNGAYCIHWDKNSYDNGWIGDGNLTLVEPRTVKSAVEAKTDLEKEILGQIQEYNKTYGVVVSDINLRSYSSLTVSGQRDLYYSVEIEVKL